MIRYRTACEILDGQYRGRRTGSKLFFLYGGREVDADLRTVAFGTDVHVDFTVWNNKIDETSIRTVQAPPCVVAAVSDYLRESERFNAASSDFTRACKALRQVIGKNADTSVHLAGTRYFVKSDADDNFDVEKA